MKKFTLTQLEARFVYNCIPDGDLKDRLGKYIDKDGLQLFRDIQSLLSDYGLSEFYIPTIDELGKIKGGYALVKRISEAGGLRKIRPAYAKYINEYFSKFILTRPPVYYPLEEQTYQEKLNEGAY